MKQEGTGYKQLNHLQANSHKQFIKEEKKCSGHEKRNGKLKIKFFQVVTKQGKRLLKVLLKSCN